MGIFDFLKGKKDESTSEVSSVATEAQPQATANADAAAVKPSSEKQGDKAKNVCEFC